MGGGRRASAPLPKKTKLILIFICSLYNILASMGRHTYINIITGNEEYEGDRIHHKFWFGIQNSSDICFFAEHVMDDLRLIEDDEDRPEDKDLIKLNEDGEECIVSEGGFEWDLTIEKWCEMNGFHEHKSILYLWSEFLKYKIKNPKADIDDWVFSPEEVDNHQPTIFEDKHNGCHVGDLHEHIGPSCYHDICEDMGFYEAHTKDEEWVHYNIQTDPLSILENIEEEDIPRAPNYEAMGAFLTLYFKFRYAFEILGAKYVGGYAEL